MAGSGSTCVKIYPMVKNLLSKGVRKPACMFVKR